MAADTSAVAVFSGIAGLCAAVLCVAMNKTMAAHGHEGTVTQKMQMLVLAKFDFVKLRLLSKDVADGFLYLGELSFEVIFFASTFFESVRTILPLDAVALACLWINAGTVKCDAAKRLASCKYDFDKDDKLCTGDEKMIQKILRVIKGLRLLDIALAFVFVYQASRQAKEPDGGAGLGLILPAMMLLIFRMLISEATGVSPEAHEYAHRNGLLASLSAVVYTTILLVGLFAPTGHEGSFSRYAWKCLFKIRRVRVFFPKQNAGILLLSELLTVGLSVGVFFIPTWLIYSLNFAQHRLFDMWFDAVTLKDTNPSQMVGMANLVCAMETGNGLTGHPVGSGYWARLLLM